MQQCKLKSIVIQLGVYGTIIAIFAMFHMFHKTIDAPSEQCSVVDTTIHDFRVTFSAFSAGFSKIVDDETHCIATKTVPSFIICVYDPSYDIFISSALLNHGVWEPINTKSFVNAIRKYSNAFVIDVGANIGYYTLLSAQLGHKVLAIEPSSNNAARIVNALRLGRLSSNVSLLLLAVSDKRAAMKLTISGDNQGGLELLEATGERYPTKNTVCAITMDDLLIHIPPRTPVVIIKIDIEGHECRALKHSKRLLSSFYVPYIFMEWSAMYSKRNQHKSKCTSQDMLQLARYLASSGYAAHDITYGVVLDPETCTRSWRVGDVYWRHKSAFMLHDTFPSRT